MYEKGGIVYGKEQLTPRVESAQTTNDYKILLTFTNGEQRIFDATPLLTMKVFKPLQQKSFFASVKVVFGTLQWPQNIDYCPDCLYNESAPAFSKQ